MAGGFSLALTGNTIIEWNAGNQSYGACNSNNRPQCTSYTNATFTAVCLGPTGQIGTAGYCADVSGQFGDNQPQIVVRNLRVDCKGAQNVSGLVDNTGEENTYAHDVTITSCSNDYNTTGVNGTGATNALRIGNPNDGNVAENSGDWGDIQIEYALGCTATALPLLVYDDVQTLTGHITLNNIGEGTDTCPKSGTISSTITKIVGTGTIATMTLPAYMAAGVGNTMTISGAGVYNGTYALLSIPLAGSGCSGSSCTYTFASTNTSTVTSGTATMQMVAVAAEVSGNSVQIGNVHTQASTIGLEVGGLAGGTGMVIGPINCDRATTTCVNIASNHATGGVVLGVEVQGGSTSNNLVDSQASPTYSSGPQTVDFYQFGSDLNVVQSLNDLGNLLVSGSVTSNGNLNLTAGSIIGAPVSCIGRLGFDTLCPKSPWWYISGTSGSTPEPVAGINGTVTAAHAAVFSSSGNEVQDAGAVQFSLGGRQAAIFQERIQIRMSPKLKVRRSLVQRQC